MNYKNEVIRGICFGIGQSIAGLIIVSLFGKTIYRYVIKSCNEIEAEKNEPVDSQTNADLTMQKMYSETVKDDKASEECLLSDGETIKIKQPKIVLKRI